MQTKVEQKVTVHILHLGPWVGFVGTTIFEFEFPEFLRLKCSHEVDPIIQVTS